jgi:hypothetical protein
MSNGNTLDFIRKRRALLRKELADLDAAERVILEAEHSAQQELALTGVSHHLRAAPGRYFLQGSENTPLPLRAAQPKTIQQMILQLLNTSHPGGLSADDILDLIKQHWMPSLKRTSLSPQLSRLKAAKSITNANKQWFLRTETVPEPSEGSSSAEGEGQDRQT